MMGKPNNYTPTIPKEWEWKFVYDFIMEELEEYKEACENNLGVIVTIVATHNCVSCRGVKHRGASMVTTKASGVFRHSGNDARKEYFDSIKINNGGHNI